MRKVTCLVIVLLLCVSLVMPAFAAEDKFVPSITYKPNPEIVTIVGEDGEEYAGVIRDANGEIVSYVGHGCLRITPIADVWDEEIEVPRTIEDLLLFVYESLNDGSMEIPYEKHEADLDAPNMVVRDLFDARWVCEEHRAMIEKEGYVLELKFDLGIMEDVELYVMTYDEETKEWDPIVKTVNNGDGTVTCTFEHLCAVEFSMYVAPPVVPSDDVQTSNLWLWILLLILALATYIWINVSKNKKKAAA